MAAPSNTDALGLLSAALNSSNKDDESQHLSELYNLLKAQPGNIPILLPSLISLLPKASVSIRTWIADVMDLAFCRPSLSQDTKNTLAVHAPDAILLLIRDRDAKLTKIAAQCFASMYPALFRLACNDRSKANIWHTVQAIKAQIVHLFDHGSRGTKVSVVKCYQRIIQVQSRGPADPRAQAQHKNDTNLNAIPASGHPFLQAAQLEEEGNRLFTQIVTLIFTSDVPDLIMASVNSLTILAKSRPQLSTVILRAMATWTPASLTQLSHTQVRNVEKTIRIFYLHFLRNQLAGQDARALQEALESQQRRMEQAAKAYQEKKELEAKRKRERIDEELEAPKRIKTEPGMPGPPPASQATQAGGEAFRNASVRSTGGVESNPLAAFDVKTLPIALVIDLIIANLQALTEPELQNAITRMRDNLPPEASTSQPPPASAPAPVSVPAQSTSSFSTPPPPPPAVAAPTASSSVEFASGTAKTPQIHQNGFPAADVKNEQDGNDSYRDAEGEDDEMVSDPLKVDLAEEDLDTLADPSALEGRDRDARTGPEEEEEELSLAVIENFALAPPEYLSLSESDSLIKDTVNRICEQGSAATATIAATTAAGAASSKAESGTQALWSTLVIRLATRGFSDPALVSISDASGPEADGQVSTADKSTRTLSAQADIIRSMMLEFVKADLSRQSRFAVTWMAEEWFCDRIRQKGSPSSSRGLPQNYALWLEKLVRAWIPAIDAKDRSLATFLADLPEIPPTVMDLVAELSRDKTKMVAGMSTLQDICVTRPTLRDQAASKLLQLTRTIDRATRARAIIAIKQCAGSNSALEPTILAFAREDLDLLIETPPEPVSDKSKQGEEASEDQDQRADAGAEAKVNGTTVQPEQNGDLAATSAEVSTTPEQEPKYPVDEEDVLRFVELPFSLCTKIPDMLDEIFLAYPKTPAFVQQAIQKHIGNLIRALGPNHPRILTLLRSFPSGSDSLALCVLKILTEKVRTPTIVNLVKEMVDTRDDVDPRFLVPIIADLDKAEIMKRLPKVVTILSSKSAEDKALLKSVFQSIVQMPPQGFGSVSTNLPRVRQTELLTPVELMGILHHSEKQIGLKNARSAIQLCFSMTEVYRSEVLAAVLNQLSEESNLPMLFMATVIMSVSTYKSLAGYVSKNLLSRLITKKIWLNGPLWEGFILCSKQLAPSSFGALIQLPKDQLREVVNRQPDLRKGLLDYLTQRAGGNKARLKNFLDLLEPSTPSTPTANNETTPADADGAGNEPSSEQQLASSTQDPDHGAGAGADGQPSSS